MRKGVAPTLAASILVLTIGELAAADRSHTLVMAGQADGPTFRSPGIANPYSVASEFRTGPLQTFEPLFFYNVYENEHIPWIATGFKYSGDFRTITVTLREGVEWSDGKPFTAKDVVFTFNLLKKNAAGAADMKDAAEIAHRVESATAVDPLTIEIVLTQPDPRFIYTYLTNHMGQGLFWLPEHIWSQIENPAEFRNFDPEKGLPVTTGAWRLVESTSSQNVLERRDDWWGAKIGFRALPDVKRVIGVPFGSPDRAAQLLGTNAIDVSMGFENPLLIAQIQRINPNIRTFTKTDKGLPAGSLDFWPTSLYFNHKDPMWKDVRLRKAMALAVNREQATAVAYSNANPPSVTPFPAFKPLLPAIEVAEAIAKANALVEQDLDASAALMEELGYTKNGSGLWEKDGATVNATIHGVPPMQSIGPVIAQQLKNAGFDVKFAATSESRNIIRQGKAQMALFGHFGSILDPAETLNLYHCDNAKNPGTPTFSIARWCNKEFSAIVEEIHDLAPGDPKILDLVRQAMEIWYGDVVEVPITQWIHNIPMNDTYWTNWPADDNPYSSPAFWYESGQGAWLLHNLKAVK